jgi:hypothetical protein
MYTAILFRLLTVVAYMRWRVRLITARGEHSQQLAAA